jgi:hypothetical protein
MNILERGKKEGWIEKRGELVQLRRNSIRPRFYGYVMESQQVALSF